MGGCWQEYVFCVTPLLSSTTEWKHWYHRQWCGWLLWKTLFVGLHIIPEWCRAAQSLHCCIVRVDECPGRLKLYSPCISQAIFLFSQYICSWKENIQKTFRTECAVDNKPASYEIGLFPGEVEEKTQIHQWLIFYWEARRLLRDPYWLRSSETWNPSHITWAYADKSMYFVWHHYFHLLQSENIDIISNGVDGCCGKHYS